MQERTVLDQFHLHLSRSPDADAVLWPGGRLTYRDLDQLASSIAARLPDDGTVARSQIPIVGRRSAALVAGLIAIAKAGATAVPIDHSQPPARVLRIIEQAHATIVVNATPEPLAVPDTAVIAVDTRVGQSPRLRQAMQGVAGNDAAYIIFTSGTTGTPKGVVVEHRSLAHLIAWHNAHFEMNPTCRTTLIGGVGFDVTQWEIWSPLAAGASIHILEDSDRANPGALLRFYTKHAITHAYVPTVLVPSVVRAPQPPGLKLRYLFTAGEALHPLATDHLSYTVVDYYGPTEATIFSTYHVLGPGAEHRPASIGVPIAGVEAFVVDESLNDVPSGVAGELCLAGIGVARGYLDDPDLTDQRFVRHAHQGQRLYRTGDIARRLPDGTLQFLGRGDSQVKIRGHRVELGEIESTLMRHPSVDATAVIADVGAAGIRLAAFIVPATHSSQDAVIRDLRTDLRREIPDYMLPATYHCLDSLPVTANGKTDKSALRGLLHEPRQTTSAATALVDPFEKSIADTWRELLGHADFDTAQNFFEVGGHSLLANAAVEDIGRRLAVPVYVRDLYEHPDIHSLAAALRQRTHHRIRTADPEPVRALEEDISLPPGAQFHDGYDDDQISAPAHILLTGATGFIGVHLLAELLATTGAHLHCLVRSTTTAHATQRLRQVINRYDVQIPPSDYQRISAYPADLAEPLMQMPEYRYTELAATVDVIYHCASAVNFIEPYSHMRRDNVQGLRNVIAFAAQQHTKPLILASTISVYSWGHLFTGKVCMYEDDDIDQNLSAVSTDIGYVRSKWVMEKIADLAATRGLPLMIFRLGYATCHSRTGQCAEYQWWGRLVRTCLALSAVPDLQNLREGLTTVDYMTRAMATISRRPSALGLKFNLIPSTARNLTLHEFFHRVRDQFGHPLAVIPFREWVALWHHDRHAPLYPLLSMYEGSVFQGSSTVELYQNTYLWDRAHVDSLLSGAPVPEPDFSGELLGRYLDRLLLEPYEP